MLRETALLPMDVADLDVRRVLTRSCLRVSSAYDAALGEVDAGPVKKIVVALWGQQAGKSDSDLPDRLTREDDVVEVSRSVFPADLLAMPSHERADHLLRLHHGAVHVLADRYGWGGEGLDAALAGALQGGILARYSLPSVIDKKRRWRATASGLVDDDGLRIDLTVEDASTGQVMASEERRMNGDWHLLRGALKKLSWRGDTVTIEPLGKVAGGLGELPKVTMTPDQP